METENIAYTIQEISENTQAGYILFPNQIDNSNISISASIGDIGVSFESFNRNDDIVSGSAN